MYLCGWKIILFPSINMRYIVPLQLENHILAIYLCEVYHTSAVGKPYLSSSIYVKYIVPLPLENHTIVIHLRELYCTSVVEKSYLSLSIYVRYIVLSEYEFQSHSFSNHQLFILHNTPIHPLQVDFHPFIIIKSINIFV